MRLRQASTSRVRRGGQLNIDEQEFSLEKEDVYPVAWDWLLNMAMQVLEDDTNEDGLPEDYYDAVIEACWDIIMNPSTTARFL